MKTLLPLLVGALLGVAACSSYPSEYAGSSPYRAKPWIHSTPGQPWIYRIPGGLHPQH